MLFVSYERNSVAYILGCYYMVKIAGLGMILHSLRSKCIELLYINIFRHLVSNENS